MEPVWGMLGASPKGVLAWRGMMRWMAASCGRGTAPGAAPCLAAAAGLGLLGAAELRGGPADRLGWRSLRFSVLRLARGSSAPLAVVHRGPLWAWACPWAWGMEEMALVASLVRPSWRRGQWKGRPCRLPESCTGAGLNLPLVQVVVMQRLRP